MHLFIEVGGLPDSMTDSRSNRYTLLQVLIFVLFALGPIVGNLILVLQGAIGAQFQETPQEVLIAIPAFMFPFAIVQLFSGALSDIRGRIPVIFLGLVIFGIGNAVAAIATQLPVYIIANILTGIGFGFINPVLIATITDITPGPSIPWKVSLLAGVATLGVGLGPLLGGFFVTFGWQVIYVLLAITTFLSFVVLFIIRHPSWKAPPNAGVKALAQQFAQEWRRPVVLLMMASAFLVAQGYLSIAIMTSTAVSGKIAPPIWGAVLLFMGLVGATAAVISGNYNKKKGPALVFWIGGICVIVAIGILLTLGESLDSQNLPMLTLALLIAGVAGGTLLPAIFSYSQVLSPSRRGALAGSLTASYFIGIALVPEFYGPLLEISIFQVYIAIGITSIVLLCIVALLYFAAKAQTSHVNSPDLKYTLP